MSEMRGSEEGVRERGETMEEVMVEMEESGGDVEEETKRG